jgi:hypothetical protein
MARRGRPTLESQISKEKHKERIGRDSAEFVENLGGMETQILHRRPQGRSTVKIKYWIRG